MADRHSAMTKMGKTKLDYTKHIKLKFKAMDKGPIASRDFGLMRATTKSSTPYPRVDKGIDAILLKARLTRHQMANGPDADVNGPDALHVSLSQTAHRPSQSKDFLSIGTPHPKKGVELSAKKLIRQLSTIHDPKDIGTPLTLSGSRKKGVLFVVPSKFELTSPKSPPNQSEDGSFTESLLSAKSSEELSFAEKRRQFNKGEYTIAKFGRKMNDTVMALSSEQHTTPPRSTEYLHLANEEIERFIKAQGLIRTSHNQVTMTRSLHSLGESQTSRTKSIVFGISD